ncbi:MAG TPA: hypothetical protein DC049_19435 [Spirochaetia bacterium]|nr:hypothetical protein [Spirochaetia bacterium]
MISLNSAVKDEEVASNKIFQEKNNWDIKIRDLSNHITYFNNKAFEMDRYISNFMIYAPGQGFVFYPKIQTGGMIRKVQIGDNLEYGQVFLEIPDFFSMLAEAEITEENIMSVAQGQNAEIIAEACTDKIFTGRVNSVSRLAKGKDDNKYIRVFTVKIKINEIDIEKLKPGMNVKIHLFPDPVKNRLYVPAEYIFTEDKKIFVYGFFGHNIRPFLLPAACLIGNHYFFSPGPEQELPEKIIKPDKKLKFFLKKYKGKWPIKNFIMKSE